MSLRAPGTLQTSGQHSRGVATRSYPDLTHSQARASWVEKSTY